MNQNVTDLEHYNCQFSAMASLALIFGIDGNLLFIKHHGESHLSAASGINLPMLTQGVNDWLPGFNLTLDEIEDRVDSDAAWLGVFMDMAVILEPGDIEFHDECAAEIEERLADNRVAELIRNQFYANIMPAEDMLTVAIQSAQEAKTPILLEILREIQQNQTEIVRVRHAFEAATKRDQPQDMALFRALSTRNGLFRLLVQGATDEAINAILAEREFSHYPEMAGKVAAWRSKI